MALIEMTGRGLGVVAAAAAALLWVYAIWFPSGGLTISGASVVVAGLMTLLAIFAGIASVKGHPRVLIAIFVASFLPVGGYLLGVDHWVRWIGVIDLALLAAALLMLWGRRATAAQS